MIRCLTASTMPCPVVIRREHTADESDKGDPELSTLTETIDIPPAIASLRHRALKPQSRLGQPGFSRSRGTHRES